MPSYEGQRLGRYLLTRKIGAGGMGEVYLAKDINLDRQVAIKILRTSASDTEAATEAVRLFQREAKAIALLDHPNILPLFDYGGEYIDGNQVIYLVMPMREDGTLAEWLRRRGKSSTMASQDVAYLISQAASALQYAHDHQIIHQDVKPSNFLIRINAEQPELPTIQLADFGIAKFTNPTLDTGPSIRGTPTYMAPEQWAGEPTPATDQYALAIMAYELLTGRPPFVDAVPYKMMYQQINDSPLPPSMLNPTLPRNVDTVLLHALAKHSSNRFKSISAFAQALQQACKPLNSQTPSIPLSSSFVPPPPPQGDLPKGYLPPITVFPGPQQMKQGAGRWPVGTAVPPSWTQVGSAHPAAKQSTGPFKERLLVLIGFVVQLVVTGTRYIYRFVKEQVLPRIRRLVLYIYSMLQQELLPRLIYFAQSTRLVQSPAASTREVTLVHTMIKSPSPSTIIFAESEVPQDALKDFFITYNHADILWAKWIAAKLEKAGYSTIMPAWDFRPGSNFEMEMRKASAKTKRTIAILSPDYLNVRSSLSDWISIFKLPPIGEQEKLLPICVRDCGPRLGKLLGPMVYINLGGLDEQTAHEMLLAGVRGERVKPTTDPVFPTLIESLKPPDKPYGIIVPSLEVRAVQDTGKSGPATTEPALNPEQQGASPLLTNKVYDRIEAQKLAPSPKGQLGDARVFVQPPGPPVIQAPLAKGIEIFFSYSHKDEALRDELDIHLSTLKQQALITGWHDCEIGAGREWAHEIDTQLSKAGIILLLVSPDFIASKYCYSIEMERAMERHKAGTARVIPVIIRPVDWEGTPFSSLQALPKGARAVTSWPNRDEALSDVAKNIRKAVNELLAKPL